MTHLHADVTAGSGDTARHGVSHEAHPSGAGDAPFAHVHEVALPFGSRPFSKEEELRMGAQLMEDTTARDVRTRPGPGGKKLTYMPGWQSVDLANKIFGFNGWSSQVISMRINFCRETAAKRWNVCISCTVRVTLKDGSFQEDRGNGSADNYKTESEALMLAEKEAVTDARKRALKNFGRRLGLSLYSDEHLKFLASSGTRAKASSSARNAGAQNAAAPPAQRSVVQPRPATSGKREHVPPIRPAIATAAQRPAQQQSERAAKDAAIIAQVNAAANEAAQRRNRLEKASAAKQMQQQPRESGLQQPGPADAPNSCKLPLQHAQLPQHAQPPPVTVPPTTSHPTVPQQPPHSFPQQQQGEGQVQHLPPKNDPALRDLPAPPEHLPRPMPLPAQQLAAVASSAALPPLSDEEMRRRDARLQRARQMQEQAKQRRLSMQQQQAQEQKLVVDVRTTPAPHARPMNPGIASSPTTPAPGTSAGLMLAKTRPAMTPVCQSGIGSPSPLAAAPSPPDDLRYSGQKRRPPLAEGFAAQNGSYVHPNLGQLAKFPRVSSPHASTRGHPKHQFAAASTLPPSGAVRTENPGICAAADPGVGADENELLALFAADTQ
jgi:DNA recombination protein Rad52